MNHKAMANYSFCLIWTTCRLNAVSMGVAHQLIQRFITKRFNHESKLGNLAQPVFLLTWNVEFTAFVHCGFAMGTQVDHLRTSSPTEICIYC